MTETANIKYIEELADGDTEFQSKIIAIIKDEFPKEKNIFLNNIAQKNYLKSAENVHKIKHKINILGLKKGFEIAVKFESELKCKKIDSYQDFIVILDLIDNFLNKI